MAIKYGFYNSISGDRKYNAEDFGRIFDGIIRDGVFESIYDKFQITILSGLSVSVGKGKAWFNNTWLENDANYPVSFTEAEVLLNRIDAVVMEFNSTEGVRANSIKVVTGMPGSTPQKPTLTNTDNVNQYALCYVTIPAKATSITTANLDVRIGATDCPYVVVESGEIPSLKEINKLIQDNENLNTRIDRLDFVKTDGNGTKVLSDDGEYVSLKPILIDTLTTSGTFDPSQYDSTYKKFIFILYGGGGNGGRSEHYTYVSTSGPNDHGMGGGGGAGAKVKSAQLSITAPIPYIIGASNGGKTSIGTCTAYGGGEGANGNIYQDGDGAGGTGGSGTGGVLVTTGGSGGKGSKSGEYGGTGASSDVGTGGTSGVSSKNATGYGAGGAGGEWAVPPQETSSYTYGGTGSPGVIFVYAVQFDMEAGI